MTGAPNKDEMDKVNKEYMDMMLKGMDNQIKKQADDEAFEKLMRMMMLKMMAKATEAPLTNREVPNEMPIDPDGQILSLIGEIQSSLNQLRTLILSRGRE